MTTTTLNKTPRTIIAAGTSNAATGVTRGTADLRTAHGGIMTLKITNGGSAPVAACKGRILIAHDSGATPAAGAAGAVWKTLWEMEGGITANAITERAYPLPAGAMHVEVEFAENTGNAVIVEAYLSEITSVSTV